MDSAAHNAKKSVRIELVFGKVTRGEIAPWLHNDFGYKKNRKPAMRERYLRFYPYTVYIDGILRLML